MACQKSHHLPCDYSLFLPALILTTAVLSCLPGAPSAPGCLAASGRQAVARHPTPFMAISMIFWCVPG
nr:hypothetical protein [Escherichia coli]